MAADPRGLSMIAKLPPFRFSVDQYDRMIEMGILGKDDRVELLRGEVVPKMANNPPHAGVTKRLIRLIGPQVQGRAILGVQDPVRLNDSQPEPDVSVLHPSSDDCGTSHPTPADVLMLIEVSDSSLDRDLDLKAPLYAETGIVEYWIVNLDGQAVLVHRGPRPDGTWAAVTTHARGETLAVTALPGVAVAVADVLP
jgi:Uma2 family endonuclease